MHTFYLFKSFFIYHQYNVIVSSHGPCIVLVDLSLGGVFKAMLPLGMGSLDFVFLQRKESEGEEKQELKE